jgi:hypothetical protein
VSAEPVAFSFSWKRSWAGLLGDPSAAPPQLRNFARYRFPVCAGPARLALWPVTVLDVGAADATDAALVSDLRRATGRFPHDTRLAELIRELSEGDQRFAELWATGAVAAHRADHKMIGHPSVGPITVDCDVLTDGDSDLKIVIMTAVPGSADEARLQLAAIVGTPDTTNGSHARRQAAGASRPRQAARTSVADFWRIWCGCVLRLAVGLLNL